MHCLNGFLLLDKPQGMTSHTAMKKAQRLWGAKKAGHAGSLDPLATGMLPICFGEATKFSRFVLNEKKAYDCVMQLGTATDTGDVTGQVIEEATFENPSPEKIEALVQHFLGETEQVPPMYSALKQNGQRLYRLARAGQIVERAPRKITIESISVNRVSPSGEIAFTCVCSKGTYIRSLVEDMGRFLGTCANMTALRRLWVYPFEKEQMVQLEPSTAMSELASQDALLSLDTLMATLLPTVNLSVAEGKALQQGRHIVSGEDLSDWCAFFVDDRFWGVGECVAGHWLPRRMVDVNTLG